MPIDEQDKQLERLARFLAHAGIASRRHAEALIAEGRVQVNGTTITAQGTRINPQHDRVSVDGQLVTPEVQHVYLMLHKPAGYVTTASDEQGRPTVLDLLPKELQQLRVYPVGRLDLDTSGLLLLTNDGDFALHMTHPRYNTEKHYEALVKGAPSPATLTTLQHGVVISEDNGGQYRTAPARARLLRREGVNAWITLILHEGHKRQVRRMLEAVGHPVIALRRVAIGPLTLQELPVGAWRYLHQDEIRVLMEGK